MFNYFTGFILCVYYLIFKMLYIYLFFNPITISDAIVLALKAI